MPYYVNMICYTLCILLVKNIWTKWNSVNDTAAITPFETRQFIWNIFVKLYLLLYSLFY